MSRISVRAGAPQTVSATAEDQKVITAQGGTVAYANTGGSGSLTAGTSVTVSSDTTLTVSSGRAYAFVADVAGPLDTGATRAHTRDRFLNFSGYAPASDTTDATTHVESFLDDCLSQGRIAYFDTRRVYLPNVTTITGAAGLKIVGDGPDQSIFYRDDENHYLFDIEGGAYNATATLLTSSAAAGDTTLAVASTASITAGQWINVQSDEVWDATSGKAARCGELVRVKSVDSATALTLYTPLEDDYTTANSGRVNYCPLGRGFEMVGVGFEAEQQAVCVSGAVVVRRMWDLKIEDLYIGGFDGPAMTYDACVGGNVTRVHTRELTDDEGNSRYGYGHNIATATRDMVFSHLHGDYVRHVVTTNAGSTSTVGGVPRHIRVSDSTGTAGTNVIFDTHEEGCDITFADCEAYSFLDIGFHGRAPRTKFIGCTAENGKGTGFWLRSTATESMIENAKVYGLRGTQSARSNPTMGIYTQAAESVIDGFRLDQIGSDGLRIAANRVTARNGFIKGMGKSQNPHGVYFAGSPIDPTLENIYVDGEGISSSGMSTGTAGTPTGLKVSNFRARNVTNALGSTMTSNNASVYPVAVHPATGVTEYLVTSRPPRATTAVSATLAVTQDLLVVTDTSSARTVTLPALSAAPIGKVFTILDEGNNAGTQNITIQRAGSDTFLGGGTSITIATNGGKAQVYSNGTVWVQLA